jgi:hypothetical protein
MVSALLIAFLSQAPWPVAGVASAFYSFAQRQLRLRPALRHFSVVLDRKMLSWSFVYRKISSRSAIGIASVRCDTAFFRKRRRRMATVDLACGAERASFCKKTAEKSKPEAQRS